MEPNQSPLFSSQGRKVPFDAYAIPLQRDDDSRQAERDENLGSRARYKIDEALAYGPYDFGALWRPCASREICTEPAVDDLQLDPLVEQFKQETRRIHQNNST
jgi:hypothetical protein